MQGTTVRYAYHHCCFKRRQPDTNPYARFTATSALLDYISSNFALQTIVNQRESYQDNKSPVYDGKSKILLQQSLKEDIKIVQLSRQ